MKTMLRPTTALTKIASLSIAGTNPSSLRALAQPAVGRTCGGQLVPACW